MDRIPSSDWTSLAERSALERATAPSPPPPPRARLKRIHPAVNVLFLLATLHSTLIAGAFLSHEEWSWRALLEVAVSPARLMVGLTYSLSILAILGSHEMGHFVACRLYRVDATWPFFLPGLNPFGTFGAVIRIRSLIPDRRALFDIGVAGPIAGFVVAIPILIYGLTQSTVVRSLPQEGEMLLPPCPLLTILFPLFFDMGEAVGIRLHPTIAAAWLGLFATFLNLLPLGQLDGGHMVYALSRRAHRIVSRIGPLVLILIGVLMGGVHLILFGVIFAFIGRSHPPLLEEGVGLGRGRILVAWLALLIFILCFIPSSPSIVAGGSG